MTGIDSKTCSELRLSLQAANHISAKDSREGFRLVLEAIARHLEQMKFDLGGVHLQLEGAEGLSRNLEPAEE